MNFIPKIEYIELVTLTPKTITFDSPPEGDPLGETFRTVARSRRSSGGERQTQFNYSMQRFDLEFIFQSQTVKDAYEDFFLNHSSKGGKFNYFIHSDEVEFLVFESRDTELTPDRAIPAAIAGEFEYDFKVRLERVL